MKAIRRISAAVLAIAAGFTAVLLWLNYDQDISVSLVKDPRGPGKYTESVSSVGHDICINAEQIFVLKYGFMPASDHGPRADIKGECQFATVGRRTEFTLDLDKSYDQSDYANGLVCVEINYTYAPDHEHVMHTKIACE